jgi:hypothetical protein
MWPHVYVMCASLVFLSASDLLVNCSYLQVFNNLLVLNVKVSVFKCE